MELSKITTLDLSRQTRAAELFNLFLHFFTINILGGALSPGNTFVFLVIISKRRSRYTAPRKFLPPVNGDLILAGNLLVGV